LVGTLGGLAAQPVLADDTHVSIGSTVWIDANYNGRYDAGEPTMPGVTVELWSGNTRVAVQTTSQPSGTDPGGNYLFDGLQPGQYHVRIPADQLTGTGPVAEQLKTYWQSRGMSSTVPVKALSTKDSGIAGEDSNRVDGDDDGLQASGYGNDVVSPDLVLELGNEPQNGIESTSLPGYALDDAADSSGDMTVDFGFTHQCAAICDTNGDGKVTRSDIDTIAARLNRAVSPPGAVGSGNCSGTGHITGNDRMWCQAFLQPEVGIGNRVWKEVNGTPGYQPGTGENDDKPLAGVQVTLINNDTGGTVGSATTNDQGCYIIEGVPEGNYIAHIPEGQLVLTGLQSVVVGDSSPAGNNETTDDTGSPGDQNGYQFARGSYTETSNVFHLTVGGSPVGEPSHSACGLATLPDSSVNETADFAFETAPPINEVAMGNMVWIEVNGTKGFQSGVDVPVQGALVELRNQDGTPVMSSTNPSVPLTDTTDSDGCYLFDNLPAGTYYAQIPSTEFGSGHALNGYGPLSDGGAATNYGDDPTVDDDQDQNGRPQVLTGNVVTGNVVTSQFNLQPTVQPIGEGGHTCGALKTSQLPDENVNQTADFAFESKYAIGNLVWIENNDTAGYRSTGQNPDEPVDGVQVELWDVNSGEKVRNTTTSDGGFYLFDKLSPGRYYVKIPGSQFSSSVSGPLAGYLPYPTAGGVNWTDDNQDQNGLAETDPATNGVQTPVIELGPDLQPTLEPGASSTVVTSELPDQNVNLTADFAFVPDQIAPAGLLSIGSTVWIDVNYNGLHDANEPTIPGVKVQLWSGGTLKSETTTSEPVGSDPGGNYLFSDLEPGVYTVKIPATQLTGSGSVALKLSQYWASQGLSSTVPVKALSTKDSDYRLDDVHRVDGDDDGEQAGGYGTEVTTPSITLTLGGEPVNGTGDYNEKTTLPGYDQDDTVDANGDMTVDFGFTTNAPASAT